MLHVTDELRNIRLRWLGHAVHREEHITTTKAWRLLVDCTRNKVKDEALSEERHGGGRGCGGGRSGQDIVVEEDAMDKTSWWRRTQWTGRRGGGGRNGQDVVVEEDAMDRTS